MTVEIIEEGKVGLEVMFYAKHGTLRLQILITLQNNVIQREALKRISVEIQTVIHQFGAIQWSQHRVDSGGTFVMVLMPIKNGKVV